MSFFRRPPKEASLLQPTDLQTISALLRFNPLPISVLARLQFVYFLHLCDTILPLQHSSSLPSLNIHSSAPWPTDCDWPPFEQFPIASKALELSVPLAQSRDTDSSPYPTLRTTAIGDQHFCGLCA
jgi:hypothetical protein